MDDDERVPIAIRVRDELCRDLARLQDVEEILPIAPPPLLDTHLPLGRADSYPLLAYVDPVGDTCFNRAQTAALLAELERWAQETGDPETRAIHGALSVLIAEHMRRPHRYL